jgi:2'-5' RNA ligase
MIRSFLAISLPAQILQVVEDLMRLLRPFSSGLRLTRLESLHLTLKFLGNIEEGSISAIEQEAVQAGRLCSPFSLCLEQLGFFPNSSRPRVVWVGITHDPGLIRLQQQLEDGLARLGFERERRAFHPHLTLARVKSQKNRRSLVDVLRNREVAGPSFQVTEFHLFRSILHPHGAEYRKLVSVGLEGS